MIHFWILKYILYCTFTKRNVIASYYEGSSLGLLILMPILSLLMLSNLMSEVIKYPLLFGIITLIFILNWDDKKVFDKYKYIEQNKESFGSEFKQVYWFIVLNILFFIVTLIIVTIRRSY